MTYKRRRPHIVAQVAALLLGLLVAACNTTPETLSRQQEAVPDSVFAPLGVAPTLPELEQRLSMAGLVAEFPAGWRARRHHDVRPFILAEILSPVGETVVSLIRVETGGPVAPDTLLRFLLAEALLLEDLEAQSYLQPLEDGSYYAGVSLEDGEAVRLRFYQQGPAVHAVAVLGLPIAVEREEVEAMLLSLRSAESEESNYRYRPSGVSIIERGEEPWIWIEDVGGGVALTSSEGSGDIVAALTTLDSWEIEGAPRNAEFWVGPRRVMAAGEVEVAEVRRELYRFELDGTVYHLYLEATEEPEERSLIDEPSVRRMLATQILIERRDP